MGTRQGGLLVDINDFMKAIIILDWDTYIDQRRISETGNKSHSSALPNRYRQCGPSRLQSGVGWGGVGCAIRRVTECDVGFHDVALIAGLVLDGLEPARGQIMGFLLRVSWWHG